MGVEATDVLIVGGGGTGLAASMLLSTYGVRSILVNDRPTTSRLPKAHMLNQRTMEVLRELGLAEAVYERGTPPGNMRHTGWYAGLAGPSEDHGRLIGRIEVWGCGYEDPDYVAASPCRTANLPQMHLEPLMRARAEELAEPGGVRFHHELLRFEQDGEKVTAVIRDHPAGNEYEVLTAYLIAADAGRTVGPALGVTLAGEPPSAQMVTVFMSADLSRWVWDDAVVSYHLINPDVATAARESCTLLAVGPDAWGSRSPQWYVHMMYAVDDEAAFDDAEVLRRMLAVLGLPDLDPEVHVINRWTVQGLVADRFRDGRVFLAGDAAHRNPPYGGLGLNTGIGDAFDLSWKLAEVLAGQASERLLDSYEAERRPHARLVVGQAMANARRGTGLNEALGIVPGRSPEEHWRALRELWAEGGAGAARRMAVREILQRHSMDYRDHNIEVGLPYAGTPLMVSEGSPAPVQVDPVRVYQPTTMPGHPLPHAWVEDGRSRVSLRDLAAGRWLLVCGEEASEWCAAGRLVASQVGLPLLAVRVGHASGDWFDVRCAWLRQREIGPRGCVLVRPDRYIAWRSPGAPVGDAAAVLGAVLGHLLG